MPILSKIIGKSFLNNISKRINVTKKDVSTYQSNVYPHLLFRFCLDSKASIDFNPIELIAYVHNGGAFIGKIYWNKSEKIFVKRSHSIASTYELDEVEELKAMNETWINLHFAPPLQVFKSNIAYKWHLELFLSFSSKLGNISKHFSLDFKIRDDEIEDVNERFF